MKTRRTTYAENCIYISAAQFLYFEYAAPYKGNDLCVTSMRNEAGQLTTNSTYA
jgi:hypothetical protein